MAGPKKLNILLVDDDSADRELFALAMEESSLLCSLHQSTNGREALSYLENAEKMPDVIFLDLNMPEMDGREALKNIKVRWDKQIVFILSTSGEPHDINNCYEQGANLYLIKPSDFSEIVLMIKNIHNLFCHSLVTSAKC